MQIRGSKGRVSELEHTVSQQSGGLVSLNLAPNSEIDPIFKRLCFSQQTDSLSDAAENTDAALSLEHTAQLIKK